MSSGLIYAIVKLLIGKYNNYKIFENVFPHVINGLHLYVEYPTEYYDVNHYGPIFALVIAPFSILPEWLGMIFWILMNTYFLFGNYIPVCTGTKLPLFLISFYYSHF